jgi:spermidine synthase
LLSGFCALVYQTVWLRQFRLVFGASTFATAAVLAVFLGGLGAGGVLLGRQADSSAHPLRLYAILELLVAFFAGISPLLIRLMRNLYIASGGSATLGVFGATLLRLVITVIVLGPATILMGGTLPATTRAVETASDTRRRRLALLYGMNTLGAVIGTIVATFSMLERLGNHRTLFVAVVLNLIVGVVAFVFGGAAQAGSDVSRGPLTPTHLPGAERGSRFVLIASGIVGFAFLLMELVWYRMLAPILGGSTFTFGLILAVALLGTGLGGLLYSVSLRRAAATPAGFALTCAGEALALAIPLAAGDRVALVANSLRSFGVYGFGGQIAAWTVVALFVVFPASVIAGVQFPLLIALLGSGDEKVGSDVGRTYAANTIGAIAGSLAGGFGLMPLLSAPGCWRAVIVLLAATSLVAAFAGRPKARIPLASQLIAIVALACIFAQGPTAVWRHSGIGAGRAPQPESPTEIRDWVNETRRTMVWDADGRESSVALVATTENAFFINGKSDGAARQDAGTQVLGGLIGALVHPNPRAAMVIGLGTGSTAGWLGAIPSMQRVDVVELEPAILRVARDCAAVNHDVMHNPKVRITIGDAREVLTTSRRRYDVIFSEPSNPYRAGIASLFTWEFYQAAVNRLNDGGVFLQWVQSYEVDAPTIRTVYATIGSVFPYVETWMTERGDLVLLASERPIVMNPETLRARLREEPFRSAFFNVWRADSLEGVLAHYVANDGMTSSIVDLRDPLNTDDRTLIEFGFARMVGSENRFHMQDVLKFAHNRSSDMPHLLGGIDWQKRQLARASVPYIDPPDGSPEERLRHEIASHYADGDLARAYGIWSSSRPAPLNVSELSRVAELLANAGSEDAVPYIARLRTVEPVEADAIEARLLLRERRYAEATDLLARALVAYRNDPWPSYVVMSRTVFNTVDIARATHDVAMGAKLSDALSQPFAANCWNDSRLYSRLMVLSATEGCSARTVEALKALEPYPPFRLENLMIRADCYAKMGDALTTRAREELAAFRRNEPEEFVKGK